MNWLAKRLVVASGLVFLLAAGARAQIVVQGIVKPDDVPVVESDQALEADRLARRPWSLRVGVNEFVETTPQPEAAGVDSGDLASQLNAALGYDWAFPRGGVSVSGNAAQVLYRQDDTLNQFLYGGGIHASYLVSPRLSWNVGEALTSSYAQDLTTIGEAGLLPPKVLTHVNTASGGLRYDLSPKTQMNWGIAEQNVSFGSSPLVAAAQLTGASTFSTHLYLTRQITQSQSLGVSGEYQRTVTNGTVETQQALLGTWQQALGSNSHVTASAGIRPYTLPGQSGFSISPALSFGFNTRLRRTDTLALRYNRSVEQGLGIGTNLTQEVGANYGLSWGTRLGLEVGGLYARGTYPQDPSLLLLGKSATLSVHCLLMRDLTLGLGSSVYVRTDAPAAAVPLYRVSTSLTYGLAWR